MNAHSGGEKNFADGDDRPDFIIDRVDGGQRVRLQLEVKHHLKAWRSHRDLSLEELARLAGLTASLISQIELGKSRYTQNSLERLAEALGVTPGTILDTPPERLDDPTPQQAGAEAVLLLNHDQRAELARILKAADDSGMVRIAITGRSSTG